MSLIPTTYAVHLSAFSAETGSTKRWELAMTQELNQLIELRRHSRAAQCFFLLMLYNEVTSFLHATMGREYYRAQRDNVVKRSGATR